MTSPHPALTSDDVKRLRDALATVLDADGFRLRAGLLPRVRELIRDGYLQ